MNRSHWSNLKSPKPSSSSSSAIGEASGSGLCFLPDSGYAISAYDQAAIKFRGVDADINFNVTDYDEDMMQDGAQLLRLVRFVQGQDDEWSIGRGERVELQQSRSVAGGDGTVGWVLECLVEPNKESRNPISSIGIIPLGIENDLSRSFGWGGSFPFAWKSAIKKTLNNATSCQICRLDSYTIVMELNIVLVKKANMNFDEAVDKVLLSIPTREVVDPPPSLKHTEECALDEVFGLSSYAEIGVS
ncbi:hypothetical protein F8388_014726 [Cannabis sativa]|uniref:DAGKc domain-containing protein n=1 Tax=Cannabis sativa TaxID=3483 RepID=A0A7J6GYQ5_CANSA|nr:hypothetical protein F8388_014726 [Cannabis sativa]